MEKTLRGRLVVDALFYDLSALSAVELVQVEEAAPGSLLVIHPGKGEAGRVPIYPSVESFLTSEHRDLGDFVLAGLGSSGAGTAALARNVADAFGRPVVGIVSCQGWRDLLTEGVAGLLDLNLSEKISRSSRFLTGLWREMTKELFWGQRVRFRPSGAFIPGMPESETLLDLLVRNQKGVRTILGHSKGNLSIANCLFGLREQGGIENPDMHIITLACGVNVPPVFHNLHQFVGTWDPLGIANTTAQGEAWRNINWVWFKGHDVNNFSGVSLPVSRILEKLQSRVDI